MANNQIALLAQVPNLDPLVPAQRQAQLRALAYQEEQQRQAQADDASYRAALQANPQGGAGLLNALAGSGNYKAHAATQKAEQERLKSNADIKKSDVEAKSKAAESAAHQFEIAGQLAGAWANNPGVTKAQIQAGLNAAVNSGVISPEIGSSKLAELDQTGDDPTALNQWAKNTLTQVMKAKDQFALTTVDANTKANNETSVENNKRTNATTQRGQNITSATAAADRAQRGTLAQAAQYDTERGVLVDRRTGTARQVTDAAGQPLGTKEKPLTEFQGKSAAFADRALLADQALSGLDYNPAAINSKAAVGRTPLIGGALEAATNAMLSPENQRAEQAQRDFVNAVLRQESGAAIGKDEFDNARKQYFPQPGDSEEVIAQKATNRQTAIAGLQRNAGASYKAPGRTSQPRGGAPNTNARGWALHVDANGNRAYVSPDGKQFEEVR